MHAKGASLNSRAHYGHATADVSIAHRLPQLPFPAGLFVFAALDGKTQTFSLPFRPPRRQVCASARRGASMTASDQDNLANKEVTWTRWS